MDTANNFLTIMKNALYGISNFWNWLNNANINLDMGDIHIHISALAILTSTFVIGCISIMIIKKVLPTA